ncbi:hypothetical protein GUITHDRAFT_154643, partial [Guillardia theta CCMP2712]
SMQALRRSLQSAIARRFLSSNDPSLPSVPEIKATAEQIRASESMTGMQDVRQEVNRVMANPEINGCPVPLDFSSGGKTKGYSRKFAENWDQIVKNSKKER